MNFFGRGVSAFFNQFFKWLFWNKKGQKLLFSILIVVIFFVFIKCGEVAAVEEVTDINYEVKSYYDGVINDAILRLWNYYKDSENTTLPASFKNYITNGAGTYVPYFYYGDISGSSYNNARPQQSRFLNIILVWRGGFNNFTTTSNDYLGVTGQTMYQNTSSTPYLCLRFDLHSYYSYSNQTGTYVPQFAFTYTNENWTTFIQALSNNDIETITSLLEDIKDSNANIEQALTNTEPTSTTDSFVDVDSSSVDDLSSASVDNVFSTMTTGFANKFTNYDLSTVNSFVWNLNGTRITFYSDTLYKMIQGTFFETLLSMLWYYIFGHYAFVWLSNIIHKIKDGSILDGLEVNEVITKEML